MGKKKMFMRSFLSVNNTFIGGVSSVLNTPTLLADRFQNYPSGTPFSAINIKNFTIIGNDIECLIEIDYEIKSIFSAIATYFRDYGFFCKKIYTPFNGASNFVDFQAQGLLSIANVQPFRNTLITELYFPNLTYIHDFGFNLIQYLKVAYMPLCVNFGSTVLNNSVMVGTSGVKLYVNPFLETANSGSPDGDLVGQNVSYVTNFTAPNQITDLAVVTVYSTVIELSWTEPTNINGIDYYEIYVDGVLNKTTTTINEFVFGLTASTSYNFTVIPVDNFYNKSIASNIVTQTTNTTPFIPISNIISYWKFENYVLDSVGTNDGVATAITYAVGEVGDASVFNGSSSFIQIADNNNLSFGNGATDISFSISFWVKLNSLGDAWLINKRDGSGSPVEYQISLFSGNLRVQLFGQNSTATQLSYSVGNTLSIGVWSQIFITYDGSSSQNGLNFYVNSIEQGGTKTQTGTYVAMSNTSSSVIFGKAGWFSGFYLNGSMDETIIWDKELTQTEIDNVYAKGNARLPLI